MSHRYTHTLHTTLCAFRSYFACGSADDVALSRLQHAAGELIPSLAGVSASRDMAALQASTLNVWVKSAFKHLLGAYGQSVRESSSVASSSGDEMCEDGAEPGTAELHRYTDLACVFLDLVTAVRTFAMSGVRGKTALVSEAITSGLKFVQLTGRLCDSLRVHAMASDARCALVWRCACKVQKSTRVLQIFCAEGKRWQDKALLRLVPGVRRALERLLYQMKLVFADRPEYATSWQIGKLKHRDLEGNHVSSQYVGPQAEDSGGETELEELEE